MLENTNVAIISEAEESRNVSEETATSYKKKIKEHLCNTVHDKIHVGNLLNWFKLNEAYKILGYMTFEEFVEAEFGMKRSSADNYINVAKTFSYRKENSDTGKMETHFAKECNDYTFSQLIVLINVPAEQRRLYNPEMSVRQMKDALKKSKNSQEELNDDNLEADNFGDEELVKEGEETGNHEAAPADDKVTKRLNNEVTKSSTESQEILASYTSVNDINLETVVEKFVDIERKCNGRKYKLQLVVIYE